VNPCFVACTAESQRQQKAQAQRACGKSSSSQPTPRCRRCPAKPVFCGAWKRFRVFNPQGIQGIQGMGCPLMKQRSQATGSVETSNSTQGPAAGRNNQTTGKPPIARSWHRQLYHIALIDSRDRVRCSSVQVSPSARGLSCSRKLSFFLWHFATGRRFATLPVTAAGHCGTVPVALHGMPCDLKSRSEMRRHTAARARSAVATGTGAMRRCWRRSQVARPAQHLAFRASNASVLTRGACCWRAWPVTRQLGHRRAQTAIAEGTAARRLRAKPR
jgi:hypothetical protein